MGKVLFSSLFCMLFVLDVLASAPRMLQYNDLTVDQVKDLTPLPTKKIELSYSKDALGFLGTEEQVKHRFDATTNPFQAQFFNTFSAEQANKVAKEYYCKNTNYLIKGISLISLGIFPLSFQAMDNNTLAALFYAGLCSFSLSYEKSKEKCEELIQTVARALSVDNQPYFIAVIGYLHKTVLDTLNYAGFKNVTGLADKIERIQKFFYSYDKNIVPADNRKTLVVAKNDNFDQFRSIFSADEWNDLEGCPASTIQTAVMRRTTDIAVVATRLAVETKKQVEDVKGQLDNDRKTAEKIVGDLNGKISNLESDKKEAQQRVLDLQKRIAALEDSLKIDKQKQETKQSDPVSLLNESQQLQIQKEKDTEKVPFSKENLVSTSEGKRVFKFSSRWNYEGEISESGNNLEAEGNGEFRCGHFIIKGCFSHNSLDLSNAVIKYVNTEFSFNTDGYFNMENIKMIKGTLRDTQKKQIIANMSDGSKYIFSQNLIQYINQNGEISTVIPENKVSTVTPE